MDKQLTQSAPVHYWYSESKRTACHIANPEHTSTSYDVVDCEWCRRVLGWPDPLTFPNLSSDPGHITNTDHNCPNCNATKWECNQRLTTHPSRCCGPCKRHEVEH